MHGRASFLPPLQTFNYALLSFPLPFCSERDGHAVRPHQRQVTKWLVAVATVLALNREYVTGRQPRPRREQRERVARSFSKAPSTQTPFPSMRGCGPVAQRGSGAGADNVRRGARPLRRRHFADFGVRASCLNAIARQRQGCAVIGWVSHFSPS